MIWWVPETLYHTFLGTDAELFQVVLPLPTQECIAARTQTAAVFCSGNQTARRGDPAGACEDAIRPLQKYISGSLERYTAGSSIPDALKSPALPVLRQFQITEHQLGELFLRWEESNKYESSSSSSPREAVCQWAAENLAFLQSFVPQTYPRVIRNDEQHKDDFLPRLAQMVGAVAVLSVLATAGIVYQKRTQPAMRYAQIEFLVRPGADFWFFLHGWLPCIIDSV